MCSSLPAAPVNGSVFYRSGDANSMPPFDFATVAKYNCDYGFVMFGEKNSTCGVGDGVEGVWSGRRPSCEGGSLLKQFSKLHHYKNDSYN